MLRCKMDYMRLQELIASSPPSLSLLFQVRIDMSEYGEQHSGKEDGGESLEGGPNDITGVIHSIIPLHPP
jgi:hypothetical protein